MYQKENTEVKNTITALNNSIEGLNITPEEMEERISKLKDRAVEFIQRNKMKNK